MRPPKKHRHNQKHCYWFSKWYFPHWILADLQLRLSKLWGIICSTTKSQNTSGCFKLCCPFLTFPSSLAPYYYGQLQSPLTDSIFSPPEFYFGTTMPPLIAYNLFSWESAFVSSKPRVYTQPAGPDHFLFKYRCALLFHIFCPWLRISKYSHRRFFFPVPNFCSSLVITKMQPCVCGYHTAWCCSWLLCPLPTILFIICLEAKPINTLE